MAIIGQLKGINRIFGFLNVIGNSLGVPGKGLLEDVMVGLPQWDPPEPRPPEPPDEALVARVKEAQGMAAQQEQRAFEKAMQTWRKVRDGQRREPAEVPGRRQEPPAAVPPGLARGNQEGKR